MFSAAAIATSATATALAAAAVAASAVVAAAAAAALVALVVAAKHRLCWQQQSNSDSGGGSGRVGTAVRTITNSMAMVAPQSGGVRDPWEVHKVLSTPWPPLEVFYPMPAVCFRRA